MRDGSGSGGNEIRWWRRRRAVAVQVEKEAELPRPAPTGSVDLTAKPNDGLNQCKPVRHLEKAQAFTFRPHVSSPCTGKGMLWQRPWPARFHLC